MTGSKHIFRTAVLSIVAYAGFSCGMANAGYLITNLVSNGSVPAATTDPNLVNPWGVAYSPTGPFWISDNNTNVSTLYTGTGSIIPLVVSAPNPTGQVFNADSAGFRIGASTSRTNFIFAGDNNGGSAPGTISAWSSGTKSSVVVTSPGASYTGITQGSTGGQTYLYAANSAGAGGIDVFNSNYQKVTLAGSFTDPSLPAGYTPFNVQVLHGAVYVTYTNSNSAGGAVAEFNLNGTFKKTVASGGALNQPWGLDIAPAAFGALSNDLLVGNFGNGTITAFNAATDQFVGQLVQSNGQMFVDPGLWSLINGNGGRAGSADSIYFTAGGANENAGVFGRISSVPEPASLVLMLTGLLGLICIRHATAKRVPSA